MTREETILSYMKSLEISREEAEQLYEDDLEDFIGDEGEQMTEKAKQIKRYEKAEKPKEKKKREVKLDEDKIAVIKLLFDFLKNETYLLPLEEIIVKNPQKEITFQLNGCEYSLNLVKHRPPKK